MKQKQKFTTRDNLVLYWQQIQKWVNTNYPTIGRVDDLASLVSQVESTANNALTQANNVYDLGTTIQPIANNALGRANDAYALAQAVEQTAGQALGTANNAWALVKTVESTANSGLATANAAQANASAAINNALNALGKANDVYGKATDAHNAAIVNAERIATLNGNFETSRKQHPQYTSSWDSIKSSKKLDYSQLNVSGVSGNVMPTPGAKFNLENCPGCLILSVVWPTATTFHMITMEGSSIFRYVAETENNGYLITSCEEIKFPEYETDKQVTLATLNDIPTLTSQLTNDSGFLTQHQSLAEYAKKTDIPTVPTKVSQLTNDSNYINLTTAKASLIPFNEVLMPTNPFGGKRLYINSIDNALYSFNRRYYVTVTTHKINIDGVTYPHIKEGASIQDADYWVDSPVVTTQNADYIFNGNYETGCSVTDDYYMKVHIQFSNEQGWNPKDTTSAYPSYPYGTFYLSYYYTGIPAKNSQMRTYNKYEAHGVGWKIQEATQFSSNTSGYIEAFTNEGDYKRTCIEFIIFGKKTGSYNTNLTQIEWKLSRPMSGGLSVVSKYDSQKLYKPFYWGAQDLESRGIYNVSIDPNGTIAAKVLKTINGTSSQFLKADGSVDSNKYVIQGNPIIANSIQIGNTIITEDQLKKLLALIQ